MKTIMGVILSLLIFSCCENTVQPVKQCPDVLATVRAERKQYYSSYFISFSDSVCLTEWMLNNDFDTIRFIPKGLRLYAGSSPYGFPFRDDDVNILAGTVKTTVGGFFVEDSACTFHQEVYTEVVWQ
jgi:hypothetical protein